MTVYGHNFVGIKAVTFGGVAGRSVRTASPARLTVVVPRHSAATVDIRIRTRAGLSAVTRADRYRYIAPPSVSLATPDVLPTSGGTRLTVHGTQFLDVTGVRLGDVSGAAVHVVSSGELLVTAPAHAPGPVDVRVTTRYGTSTVTARDRVAYSTPPSSPGPAPSQNSPPAPVTGLTVTTTHVAARLAWTGSTTANTGGVVIVRNTAHVPQTIDDGTWVTAVPSTRTTYVDGTLSPGTTYHYSVFVYPENLSSYSDPASIDATTVAATGAYWHQVRPALRNALGTGFVSCAPADFCIGVDPFNNFYRFNGTNWSLPTQIDNAYGGFTAISCTGPAFCIATDTDGRYLTWDGSSWDGPRLIAGAVPGYFIDVIDCVSPTFCVGATDTTVSIFDGHGWELPVTLPVGGANPFPPTRVSCVSVSFCMVLEGSGSTALYDGTSWRVMDAQDSFGGAGLSGMSCVAPGRCLGVSGTKAWTFDGAAWGRTTDLPSNGYSTIDGEDVACITDTYCVAGGGGLSMPYIFNGWTWSAVQEYAPAGPVVCPQSDTCYFGLIGADGTSIVHPQDPPPQTTFVTPYAPTLPSLALQGQLRSVSCTNATFCQAVDSFGNDTTWNGTDWAKASPFSLDNDTGVSRYGDDLLSTTGVLSCASAQVCVAGGYQQVSVPPDYYPLQDRAATTSWDGNAWSTPDVLSSDNEHQSISGTSCVSSTSCYALGLEGSLSHWDGSSWSAQQAIGTAPDSGQSFQAISCASDSMCVAIDDPDYQSYPTGVAYVYRGLLGWSSPAVIDTYGVLIGVSCPSAQFCVAVGNHGEAYVFDGANWSAATEVTQGRPLISVSCTGSESGAGFCAAVDDAGDAFIYSGGQWGPGEDIDDGGQLTSVSCTSASSCTAVDQAGNAIRYS